MIPDKPTYSAPPGAPRRAPAAPAAILALSLTLAAAPAQLAVKGALVYPVAEGAPGPVSDAVVVCGADGKITAFGPAASTPVPDGFEVIEAAVVTPGIIDARATVGLTGILNSERHDQEQLEPSAPIQPELRAVDAYNGRDPLVKWLRDLGVTTVQTGHAPGALVSGQLMVVKTDVASITAPGDTLVPFSAVAATLGSGAFGTDDRPPGTRAKAVAMLRGELLKARAYQEKKVRAAAAGDGDDNGDSDDDGPEGAGQENGGDGAAGAGATPEPPAPDLRLEALGAVLDREVPLYIHAQRHQDIAAALRLREEFGFDLVLDGAAEAYLLLDEIAGAGVPVVVHPTMARPFGELENMTFTLASRLRDRGIPFAFQSGYETYVPKTRVVLFEAALATAYGLSHGEALHACTAGAAGLLGLGDRIGSITPGLDADLALFDGNPFETTTRCTGVVIGGKVVSSSPN